MDLLKVHGIDYTEVSGYPRLDDLNKKLYKEFIVNLFNGLGLDSRITMIPKGIFFVEEVDFICKEDPADEYWQCAGGLVTAIDRNGMRTVHRTWSDPDYEHLEKTESKPKQYLRFEYEHQGRDEWLHVITAKKWY
jgi:hypothetical protein